MRGADVAFFVLGVCAIGLTMIDVFQSVVVPRAPSLTYRISLIVWRGLWAVWPPLGRLLYPRSLELREEFFATFAPFALIVMLVTWVVVLLLGYGAMLWALRLQIAPQPHSYWDAAYFAGSSLITLGFGDVVGRGGFARLVSLVAGATGLGVFSITTAYLFAIFGTFQRRESFIVAFSARAGAPPSGIGLFEIAARTGTQQSLSWLMREAQAWVATVMESHLAYPVLAFFRSSHDDQSWVGTLGAILDASLLANTIVDDVDHGEAHICFSLARHAVRDLSGFFRIQRLATKNETGIERADFERACDRLASAGYRLGDRDTAWKTFSGMRAEYAPYLDTLARFFHIPPIAWIGGRWAPHRPPSSPTA